MCFLRIVSVDGNHFSVELDLKGSNRAVNTVVLEPHLIFGGKIITIFSLNLHLHSQTRLIEIPTFVDKSRHVERVCSGQGVEHGCRIERNDFRLLNGHVCRERLEKLHGRWDHELRSRLVDQRHVYYSSK